MTTETNPLPSREGRGFLYPFVYLLYSEGQQQTPWREKGSMLDREKPQSPMTVHKLDIQGKIAVSYEGEFVERLANGMRIEATWKRPSMDLGYTTFETGDLFIEWYFTDQWFNILEIHGADGHLKGWYCNVTEPANIHDGVITYRDLLLDIWVDPAGKTLLLDEDEFDAEQGLDSATRHNAEHGLRMLRRLVDERSAPFDRLPRFR